MVSIGRSRRRLRGKPGGHGKQQPTRSSTLILFYLQAIDDPGMSLLDQSVIKKGKKWCATSRAEPGVMVQAPGTQTHFLLSGRCFLCGAWLSGQGTSFSAQEKGNGVVSWMILLRSLSPEVGCTL